MSQGVEGYNYPLECLSQDQIDLHNLIFTFSHSEAPHWSTLVVGTSSDVEMKVLLVKREHVIKDNLLERIEASRSIKKESGDVGPHLSVVHASENCSLPLSHEIGHLCSWT